VPAVDVDHAVAAIRFDNVRNEHDHVRTNEFDIRSVVDCETVGVFHERGGCAGFW
jgi:hypothetical protein